MTRRERIHDNGMGTNTTIEDRVIQATYSESFYIEILHTNDVFSRADIQFKYYFESGEQPLRVKRRGKLYELRDALSKAIEEMEGGYDLE